MSEMQAKSQQAQSVAAVPVPPVEVKEHDADAVAMQVMGTVLQPLVGMWAETQKTTAQESTKQTQIQASVLNRFFLGVFVVAVLVIGLAGAALFVGQAAITEKIVIALISFLGGFGAAKAMRSK